MKAGKPPFAGVCFGNYYIIVNGFVYIADHNILWSYGTGRRRVYTAYHYI